MTKVRQHRSLALIALATFLIVLCLRHIASTIGRNTLFLRPASTAQSCRRRAGDQTLRWSAQRSQCDPDVCNGARLSDIPGFLGGVPAQLACSLQHGLFDTRRARRCLADKRLLMLGDSTFVEQMHDLVMLLGGLGGNQAALDGVQQMPRTFMRLCHAVLCPACLPEDCEHDRHPPLQRLCVGCYRVLSQGDEAAF